MIALTRNLEYRVVTTTVFADNLVSEISRVAWQGNDENEMRKLYRPGCHETADGYVRTIYVFERRTPGRPWLSVDCDWQLDYDLDRLLAE